MAVDLKGKLMSLNLKDEQYQAMLLSYMIKLSSFELTRKKINAEMADKETVDDEDLRKLENIESFITDTINIIDNAVFTPCLINYLRKYKPDMLDQIETDKGKIIVMLNTEAKKAIEQEVEYFGFTREVKDEEKKE